MNETIGENQSKRKIIDMSHNTIDNFVVRLGHFQDHKRGTRSLFAQTTIDGHKFWGWFVLVDKDGFRTVEQRPAIQTIGDLFVNIFKDELVKLLQEQKTLGVSTQGIELYEHYGEWVPRFASNLHSKEFEAILDDFGYGIEFNRSRDKPRIESVRIYRKG